MTAKVVFGFLIGGAAVVGVTYLLSRALRQNGQSSGIGNLEARLVSARPETVGTPGRRKKQSYGLEV